MFNPRPEVQMIPIDGKHACYVIDGALLDPDRLVTLAQRQRDRFQQAPYNAYPGLELRMPDDFSSRLDDFFRLHIRSKLGARRTQRMYSRLSMVTFRAAELQPRQTVCHRDRLHFAPNQCVAASVLYLFHEQSLGGTSFYAPRKPAEEIEQLLRDSGRLDADSFAARYNLPRRYMTDSNDYFERLLTVPARWNRMVFYDGSLFHSGHISEPEGLTNHPMTGRLTLNGFFTCSRLSE